MKLAVIGGGVGMLSVLDHLNNSSIQASEIHIYSKSQAGFGEAYKFAPDTLLMNTRNDSLEIFNHVVNYFQWLKLNYPKKSYPDSFIPRRVFGRYLNDVKLKIVKSLEEKNYKFFFISFAFPLRVLILIDLLKYDNEYFLNSLQSVSFSYLSLKASFISILCL